ncbi:MAG: metallophosphoesterase [Deltaproteobacteria bacterium]|jgi:predicted MPP superfamily phosphohydrolase|nr:metallophosphoesterase [Deltaproteobacteria bacterium]
MTRVSLIILAFSIWYLPYRAKTVFKLNRVWPWSVVLFVLLAGYVATIMTGFYTQSNILAELTYNILGLIFLLILYLLGIVLFGHLLGKFIKRLNTPKLVIGQFVLALAIVFYAWLNAQNFTVTRQELLLPGLTQPVTVAHIPDVHLGAHRSEKYLRQLVVALNEIKPDLIIYNGDLVDSDLALRPELFALFKDIQAEQYFTTGNHEFYINTQKALDLIAQAGIKILRSETAQTHGLELIGLEYMNADRATYDAHRVNDLYLNEELPKIPRSGLPAILTHHSPVGLTEPAKYGIKVMLSGHTHAGQIFPVTELIRYRFPYYKGRYTVDGCTLIVSQGAGTFGVWARLGSFNEIQIIKFTPAVS